MKRAVIILVALCASAAAETADELKQQGLAAAQAKNWELARQKFEASYALSPQPFMLFNLATAQEQTERLVDARKSYATFLASSTAADEAKFRAIAKQKQAALDKAIPTLTITAKGFAADTAIELDGRAVEAGAALAVDPGEHAIAAKRGAQVLTQRTAKLARGARETIELIVPPSEITPRQPPPPPPPVAPPPSARTHTSVLRSKWLWLGAGAVALGVAAGGYYVAFGNPLAPGETDGTLGPTLRP